jgi:DnaJ-class molecular chaperone
MIIKIICPKCNNKGKEKGRNGKEEPCRKCNGEGTIKVHKN